MKSQWNIIKLIQWGTSFFEEKGVDEARLNIELMICHILKCKRIELYLKYDRPLSEQELALLRDYVKRRAEREPLQYILGEQEFYGMNFKVSPAVLIPRPETELLIEFIVKENENRLKDELKILDIGSGSGCISISLAKEFPNSKVFGMDISEEAIAIAKENANLNEIKNVEFHKFDYLSAKKFKNQYDIIVSNPPYISINDYKDLEPELKDYEPRIALSDEADGLTFYKKFVTDFPFLLSIYGRFYLELAYNQAQIVNSMFQAAKYNSKIILDYSGIERFVFGKNFEN